MVGFFVSNGTGIHARRVINSYELIYVISGELSMKENDIEYHLLPGDSLLLYPFQQHEGVNEYPKDLKFYWVHFNVNDYSDVGRNNNIVQLLKTTKSSDTNKIISLFNMLLAEQESNADKVVLNLILLLIMKQISETKLNDEDNKSVSLAYSAKSIIKMTYKTEITTSQIAKRLQCNPDYLGRVFRKTFNQTLTDCIQHQKIKAAKLALTEGDRNITDIANTLGFNDVGYFRRVFVKLVGITPSSYQQLYSRKTVNSE